MSLFKSAGTASVVKVRLCLCDKAVGQSSFEDVEEQVLLLRRDIGGIVPVMIGNTVLIIVFSVKACRVLLFEI